MIAEIVPTTFLGESYESERARLEIRFWYPADVADEYYRINWIEPDRNVMLGFHQDADHEDLGPSHVQLASEDTVVDRHAAAFLDAHPLAVLDERLQQLPTALNAISWANGRPSLPTWPL